MLALYTLSMYSSILPRNIPLAQPGSIADMGIWGLGTKWLTLAHDGMMHRLWCTRTMLTTQQREYNEWEQRNANHSSVTVLQWNRKDRKKQEKWKAIRRKQHKKMATTTVFKVLLYCIIKFAYWTNWVVMWSVFGKSHTPLGDFTDINVPWIVHDNDRNSDSLSNNDGSPPKKALYRCQLSSGLFMLP